MTSHQTVPLLLLVTWIVSTAPLSISSLPRNPLNSNSGVIRSISPHRSSFPLFCDPSVRDDDLDDGNDHAVDEISSELKFGRRIVKGLAKLSLLDYKWRKDIFTKAAASRSETQALNRLTGDTQTLKPLLRPMDFSSDEDELGPLGIAESKAVSWLEEVMDTEAARARAILDNDGVPVRPAKNEESPLGQIEKATVNFVDSVVQSEKARGEMAREEESVFGAFIPPSSLPSSSIGPLGKAESSVKSLLNDIFEAETVRAQLTNSGEEKRVVRPMDVGGPFGEAERLVSDIQMAEKKRAMEKSTDGKKFVRPMDATVKGPLGETEEKLVNLVDSLKVEETRRYQNLVENRPMNTNRKSVSGALESMSVGVLRAPVMLVKIAGRVKELLSGEGEGASETDDDEADSNIEEEVTTTADSSEFQ